MAKGKKEKVKKVKREKEPPKPERTESGGLDYSVYYMKKAEWLMYFLAAAVVLFVLGLIFYRNPIIAGVLVLFGLKFPEIQTKNIISKRRDRLTLQFKDMLYSLSSAVSSGSSVEMAMRLVLDDMEKMYVNSDTHIIQEVTLMVSKLNLGANIEDLFRDLADRSDIEDIRTFANIFEISKRTGGNVIKIIRQTSDIITQKIETNNEIQTLLASKKMEQKVMTAAPILLLALLEQTTGEFMAPMFQGIGRLICTVALALVIVGFLWGNKLTDIKI